MISFIWSCTRSIWNNKVLEEKKINGRPNKAKCQGCTWEKSEGPRSTKPSGTPPSVDTNAMSPRGRLPLADGTLN